MARSYPVLSDFVRAKNVPTREVIANLPNFGFVSRNSWGASQARVFPETQPSALRRGKFNGDGRIVVANVS